jgi:lactate dehydrogenase-like 2-hydroxyacid dehydrogenase
VESLQDKTMTVLGFGSIGSTCGKVAKDGFGMRVMGVDLYPSENPAIRACATELLGLD